MDDRAREIVKNLLTGLAKDYGLEFSDTDASDAITAISAYGDEREREALERAATVIEHYHFSSPTYAHFSSPTYVANRVRSLIKTAPKGEPGC